MDIVNTKDTKDTNVQSDWKHVLILGVLRVQPWAARRAR